MTRYPPTICPECSERCFHTPDQEVNALRKGTYDRQRRDTTDNSCFWLGVVMLLVGFILGALVLG